jgi:hypothetical protein
MSGRKYEWPYIARLNMEEQKSYKSDLPDDMDTYEVNRLRVSELWSAYDTHSTEGIPASRYLTDEEKLDAERKIRVGSIWTYTWTAVMFKTVWDMGHWYSMNRIKNYVYFKNETPL